MRYLHAKLGIVLRLGILSLMLAAQSLAFAHELDHLGSPDNPQCAACSVGGNLSGPVHIEHAEWAPTPTVATPSVDHGSRVPHGLSTPLRARAPPLNRQ